MSEIRPRPDDIDSTDNHSAFIEIVKSLQGTPDLPEGVAWAMTRLLLTCTSKTPSRSEILDLYAECLMAANGKRALARERDLLQ